MKISKISSFESVKWIRGGSSPIGKPNLYVNVYFVDGLLIDTGQSRMKKAIKAYVSDLQLEQIFISHHHEDHTGNLDMIRSMQTLKAWGSAKCAEIMKAPPSLSIPQKIFWGPRKPTHIDVLQGNTLDTNNHSFEVIPIHGHAADMIGLYDRQRGWFFSADLFVNHYIAYFLDNESMADQITSIRGVLDLDFDIMFCAHNPQFENPKHKLKQKLQFLEDFYGKVAAKYHKGMNAAEIMKALGMKEQQTIKRLSQGKLSKINMVRAVIRDEKKIKQNGSPELYH